MSNEPQSRSLLYKTSDGQTRLEVRLENIVKGFSLDDERLKRAAGGSYFEELLARIRDIRSSEKVFWRKVLEIYATIRSRASLDKTA